jgi:hypothetical protein
MINIPKTKRTILTYLKSDNHIPYIEIAGTGDIHSAHVLEQYIPLMKDVLIDFKTARIDEIEIVDGSNVPNHIPRYPVPADISKKFKELENQYNGIVEKKVESLGCTVHPIRQYDPIEEYYASLKK